MNLAYYFTLSVFFLLGQNACDNTNVGHNHYASANSVNEVSGFIAGALADTSVRCTFQDEQAARAKLHSLRTLWTARTNEYATLVSKNQSLPAGFRATLSDTPWDTEGRPNIVASTYPGFPLDGNKRTVVYKFTTVGRALREKNEDASSTSSKLCSDALVEAANNAVQYCQSLLNGLNGVRNGLSEICTAHGGVFEYSGCNGFEARYATFLRTSTHCDTYTAQNEDGQLKQCPAPTPEQN